MTKIRFFFSIAVSVAMCGCNGSDTSAPQAPQNSKPNTSAQRPLELIIVDDAELGSVAKREWLARSERPLNTTSVSQDELNAALMRPGHEWASADAIIFPAHMLGALAAQDWLQPIPKFVADNQQFADGNLAWQSDIAPLAQRISMWGDRKYAIPLSARLLTLGYRRDVLKALAIAPPNTIEDLVIAVESFEEHKPADGVPWPQRAFAGSLSESNAAATFLCVAAPLCHDAGRYSTLFDLRTMKPSLNSPGFERAMELTTRLAKSAGNEARSMSPSEAFNALLTGKCAFAIGWIGPDASFRSDVVEHIAFAPVPAAGQSFSRAESKWIDNEAASPVPVAFPEARLIAALRNSRSQKPAWNLAVRLSGKDWGNAVGRASAAAGPVRISALASALDQVPSKLGYEEAVSGILQQRDCLIYPRMPGASRYMAALSEVVRSAAANELGLRESLEKTAAEWEQITEELGREEQVSHYYRNLGLEP